MLATSNTFLCKNLRFNFPYEERHGSGIKWQKCTQISRIYGDFPTKYQVYYVMLQNEELFVVKIHNLAYDRWFNMADNRPNRFFKLKTQAVGYLAPRDNEM